jgi:hypothetical protein
VRIRRRRERQLAKLEEIQRAVQAWREADTKARAAEDALLERWDKRQREGRGGPSPEQLRDAYALRFQANDLFTVAMILLDSPEARG